MNANKLIEAIQDAGYEPRSYSGRGMNGRACLGVDLDNAGELFIIGAYHGLSDPGGAFETPVIDSMGQGIIAYWPRVPPPPPKE